jgi:hypothetical protein
VGHDGAWAIDPAFDYAGSFNEDGHACVKEHGQWMSLSRRDGSTLRVQGAESVDDFTEGLATVEIGGKYGFVDETGALVIGTDFDDARYFSSGLAPVKRGKRWGFIDHSGRFAIPLRLENARPFSEGAASVLEGGRWRVIDPTGRTLFVVPGTGWTSFDDGLGVVTLPGGQGLIDKRGNVVLRTTYDDLFPYVTDGEGVIDALKGHVRDLIDVHGRVLFHGSF